MTKTMGMLGKIDTWFTTGLLIASGVISIWIGLSDIFGLEHNFYEKNPISILVSIIGLIAFSLGVERAIHQRKLASQLKHIEETLAFQVKHVEEIIVSQVGGRILRGMPAIYSAAIHPVCQAKRSIRAIIYGKSPKAPPEFGDAVSRRLHETKESGNPIYFEVIFAVRFDDLPEAFREGVESRLHVFKNLSVTDQVQLHVLDCNEFVGFDALIIDEEHAFLSFPVIQGNADVQTSIYFQNQPELCRDLASWFDRRLKPASKDYWGWRNGG